ncbi:MAG: tyrosine-type recombinase/integrase [Anaerocolumna sp.]
MVKKKKEREIGKSVYQMKDGKWAGAADMPREKGEKRVRKVFYGNTKNEARYKLEEFVFQYENGDYIPLRKDTLISFLNEYYNVSKSKWQKTTQELYRMYIDVHFEPYFGQVKLIDIKPITLDKFYNVRMNESRKVKIGTDKDGKDIYKIVPPVSTNTVLKLNSFLKSAFGYALKNDFIKKNPAENVNLSSKKRYKPTVLKEEQFKTLLEKVKGTDEEIPIILGAGCGLRRGEIFGLCWGDVDFKDKTIKIERTEVRFASDVQKKPKNESSIRKIKIPDYVIKKLEEYKPKNIKDNAKIITKWKPRSFSDRFKNILEDNGLSGIRFHDLRHFNAIIMLKYGVSDKVAAERLGHAQVSTLKNIYQHVLEEMDESAATEISNIFK